MVVRSITLAFAATVLLAGCQSAQTVQSLLDDPAKWRDKTPRECRKKGEAQGDCYVAVDPVQWQWTSEVVRIEPERGEAIRFWISHASYEFLEPAIDFPDPVAKRLFDCSEQKKKFVRCVLTDAAPRQQSYKFTLRVAGEPAYDPFVWTR